MTQTHALTVARFLRGALLESVPEPVRILSAWLVRGRGEDPEGSRLLLFLKNGHHATLTDVSLWCIAVSGDRLQGLRLRAPCRVPPGSRKLLDARLPADLPPEGIHLLEGLQLENALFADESLWVAAPGGGGYPGPLR